MANKLSLQIKSNEKIELIKLEYESLRIEIQDTVRNSNRVIQLFIPFVSIFYTIPFILENGKYVHSMGLWFICNLFSSLTIFVLSYILAVNNDGIRKIGLYIKNVIEPKTNGILQWETINYKIDQGHHGLVHDETFCLIVVITLINVIASFAVGTFIGYSSSTYYWAPVLGPILLPLLGYRQYSTLRNWKKGRKEYNEILTLLFRNLDYKN